MKDKIITVSAFLIFSIVFIVGLHVLSSNKERTSVSSDVEIVREIDSRT